MVDRRRPTAAGRPELEMRCLLACLGLALALAGCSSAHDPSPAPAIIPADRGRLLPIRPRAERWTGTAGRGPSSATARVVYNPRHHSVHTESGCHNASDLPDFRNQADVAKLGPMIRCGISVHQEASWDCGSTAPESYPLLAPKNFFPTDEERAIVADWITQGAH